ncbi:MAG: hypothetical protein NTY65_08320 [Planctomycetota bacterium]|jgi:hypothetical protein|nr:hypothetical protein [Planctomycetota bacterium]
MRPKADLKAGGAIGESSMSQRNRDKRKKKKLQAARRRTARANLLQRVGKTLPEMGDVIIGAVGGIKMSVVLAEFVKPYRDDAETFQSYKTLLQLGACIWNATLLPADKQTSAIDQLMDLVPPAGQEAGQQVIYGMLRRKQEFFSQNRRAIIDFELTDTGADWHLDVMSSFEPASPASGTPPPAGA